VKWAVEATGNIYTERNSENSTIKEIQNVENLISAGVDGIIIMTTESDTGQKAAQLANTAKIPIILVDCDISEGPGKAQGRVDYNMSSIGSMLADYVIQNKIAPAGKYLIVGGLYGQSGTAEQMQGFLTGMAKAPAYKMLSEVQYADWDRKKGEDVMRNYLVMHKGIDLVYAMNEEMAFGAAVSIAEAGRQKEITLVSANGSDVGKQMLEAGTLKATMGMNPAENAILAVIKCLEYLNGTPETYRTEAPLKLFTKDNLGEFTGWDVKNLVPKYEPILKQKGYWN
jgi:ABC-type sugar transport system substrate-binding protein